MVRVLRPGSPLWPPTEDVDANDIEFTTAGGLVLKRVEFKTETNPEDIRQKRLVVSNPQLVRAYAPGTWLDLENLDLEEIAGPQPAREEAAV